jgi:hypothetical protein
MSMLNLLVMGEGGVAVPVHQLLSLLNYFALRDHHCAASFMIMSSQGARLRSRLALTTNRTKITLVIFPWWGTAVGIYFCLFSVIPSAPPPPISSPSFLLGCVFVINGTDFLVVVFCCPIGHFVVTSCCPSVTSNYKFRRTFALYFPGRIIVYSILR